MRTDSLNVPLVTGGYFDQPFPLYDFVRYVGNFYKKEVADRARKERDQDGDGIDDDVFAAASMTAAAEAQRKLMSITG